MPSFDIKTEPSLTDTVHFGKYKGEATWEQLVNAQPDYVFFLVCECYIPQFGEFRRIMLDEALNQAGYYSGDLSDRWDWKDDCPF